MHPFVFYLVLKSVAIAAVDSNSLFDDDLFINDIESDSGTLNDENLQPFSLNENIFDKDKPALDAFLIGDFSTPVNEDLFNVMDGSASNSLNSWTADSSTSLDLLAGDFISSGCLSTSQSPSRFRARADVFCTNSDEDPSTLPSNAIPTTQEDVQNFWCSGMGIVGFANIPVCNIFFDRFAPYRPTVEQAIRRQSELGGSRPLDVSPDEPGLALSPADFNVIISCYLRK